MKLTRYIYILLSIIGAAALSSCTDDYLRVPGSTDDYVKGEPTALSINILVSGDSKMSRGDIPASAESEINSVWLGFFDSETGLLMHKRMLNAHNSEGEDKSGHILGTITLDGDKGSDNAYITSGKYYIAAIANPKLHNGVLYSKDKKISSPVELDELLMNSITTFDDYLGIAYMRGDGTVGSIGTPTGNLLMQGVFIPDGEEDNFVYDNSGSSNYFARYTKSPVEIESTKDKDNLIPTKLRGYIHFRRLISQNSFKINFKRDFIESYEIQQIRVYNVPTVAWLAERADNNVDGTTNAGDIVEILGKDASDKEYTAASKVNYVESPRVFGNAIKTDESKDYYTVKYDWWQIENRRYGNSKCKEYNDREREYKTENTKGESDFNTGVYKALSESASEVNADNNATYIEIRARLKLTEAATKQPINVTSASGVTVTNMKDDPLTAGATITEADVVYTIHLGYCEKQSVGSGTNVKYVAKANDFNCRRNTKYDYTVNVNNVTSIFVEAKIEGGETYPGAEGTLSFISDKLYEADAHYCAYNIYLTDEERSDLNWQIRYYTSMSDYKDVCLEIPNEYARPDGTTVPYTDVKAKYWQWVVLRPTVDEHTIADYVPVDPKDNREHRPFYLNEVRNLVDYPGYHGYDKNDLSKGSWYTLFINEYVYGSTADGADPDDPNKADPVNAGRMTDNWREYVNMPERSVWIKVKEYRSTDHESIVINSKYAVRQKSIQTFYNSDNGKSVFGAENTNETDFTEVDKNYNNDYSKLYLYNNEYNNSGAPVPYDENSSYPRMMMYNYVSSNNIGGIGQDGQIPWSKFIHNKYWTPGENDSNTDRGVPAIFNNSDSGYQESNYKAMGYACLNRNRDLNGNGKIDLNEIRWILPNNELYTLMFFSASGLKYPLFDLRTPAKDVTVKGGIKNAKYHYATIDGDMFWSEEGCSIGNMGSDGFPTQVRCIRYLNNDTQSRATNSPIADTFTQAVEYIDDVERSVITCNLIPEALRDIRSSVTPAHRVGDESCKPYHKFEYEYSGTNYSAKKHTYSEHYVGPYYEKDRTYTNYASWAEYLSYYSESQGFMDWISSLYNNGLKFDKNDGLCIYKGLEFLHNPCSDKNVNGEIGWRPANIKELAALKEVNKLSNGSGSATICFGNDNRLLVYTSGQIRAMDTNFSIICVRDVD